MPAQVHLPDPDGRTCKVPQESLGSSFYPSPALCDCHDFLKGSEENEGVRIYCLKRNHLPARLDPVNPVSFESKKETIVKDNRVFLSHKLLLILIIHVRQDTQHPLVNSQRPQTHQPG